MATEPVPFTRPFQPNTAEQAYELMKAEILALRDDQVEQIAAEIPFAVEIVLGAADRMQSLLPLLSQVPFYDTGPVVRIKIIAAACLQAHLLASAPQPDPVPQMLEEAAALRADLLVFAGTLAHFGVLPEGTVAAIRSGTGHMDLANDLGELASLYRAYWDSIAARSLVPRAMVDRAADLNIALHEALGARRLAGDPVDVSRDPKRMRQRAYTLLVKAWDHCRRGAEFVRWEQEDADEFAPSMFKKRRRRATGGDEHAPDPEGEMPAIEEPEVA